MQNYLNSNALLAWLIFTIILGLEVLAAKYFNITGIWFLVVEFIEIVAYLCILMIIFKSKKKEE